MTIAFPSGAVQTRRPTPGRQPFGFPWSQVSRWEPLFTAAAEEQLLAPRLLAAMACVESDAQHYRHGGADGTRAEIITSGDDGFGDGPARGIMQIKFALWDTLLADNDPWTPRGNIRLGAALMRRFINETGSWQNAIREKYHPGTSPGGVTPQTYVDAITSLMEEMRVENGINWEPLPRPAMVRAIATKAANGMGFTRTTSRGPRTVGCCNHITDGDPAGDEVEFYRRFFSIGGERHADALVDLVIARNGQIGLLNDWEDNQWGGTRAGWANGSTDGVEGDGVAFVNRYPGNQINEVLVSKEHVARSGQAITDSQMASSIALSAYVAQRARVRWDTYPRNSAGLNVEQMHRNFAAKACPAEPFISTYYPVLVREVKNVLTLHQTGSTNPNPPPPTWDGLPDWLPLDHFRAAFPLADPAGIVTKAVIRWAADSGRVPVYRENRTIASDKSLWLFDGVTFIHQGNRVWVEGEAA